MNWFIAIILLLLTISIINNFIMYNKYNLYSKIPNLDSEIGSSLNMINVNIYYNKKNGQIIKKDFVDSLMTIENKYQSDCVAIIDYPYPYQIDKINILKNKAKYD